MIDDTFSLPFTPFKLEIGFDRQDTQRLLVAAFDLGCSDIRVQSGDYITVFFKRKWYPFTTRPLEHTEVERVLIMLAGATAVSRLGNGNEIDDAPEFFREDAHRVRSRYRLNAVAARVGNTPNGISLILRTIPNDLPHMDKQGFAEDLAEGLLPARGLVLVAGPTGSGKTTAIASALHERLKERPAPSILTYEDPDEFNYGLVGLGRGPLVSQVVIEKHIKDWSRAGPTAMRRKGDLILMGEVRDRESADATIEMAITGHGVYATIHADTPDETIFRIVEMFPDESRPAAASKLLGSLRTICAQKLVLTLSNRVVPLRSWILFDSEIKEVMSSPEWPYPTWGRYVRQHLRKTKKDFASQCIPLILDREITVAMFKEITLMGRDEAQRFFDEVVKSHNTEVAI